MTSVLVLGGARSGKSTYAERLLLSREHVTYVAPGPAPDPSDTEWTARIEAHRLRRPTGWVTLETTRSPANGRPADADAAENDLPAQLTALEAGSAALVDCLGTWVTRLIDESRLWEEHRAAEAMLRHRTAQLVRALGDCAAHGVDIVLVSNETGLGIVPATASGRLFRDCLGRLNTAVAAACDHAVLVVAGRVLDLTAAPAVEDAPMFGLGGHAGQLDGHTGQMDSGIDVWADAGLSWSGPERSGQE